ncbi:MAG: hypothetical protein HZB38_13285 [Planctomycetes bacterium]|nr:hypothetical protein [Planctomycetota bacterium]
MSLTDIMSNMHLSIYTQIALVIFVGVFALIVLRTWRTDRAQTDSWANLPLEDEERAR